MHKQNGMWEKAKYKVVLMLLKAARRGTKVMKLGEQQHRTMTE
jgi:hypothetical protein